MPAVRERPMGRVGRGEGRLLIPIPTPVMREFPNEMLGKLT